MGCVPESVEPGRNGQLNSATLAEGNLLAIPVVFVERESMSLALAELKLQRSL